MRTLEVIVSAIFPKLEGLDSLARRDGVDIRPTLVRVLTDLYVQKPAHTAEEERHYTELALRLIDSVDLTTRATVARKIARLCGRAAGGRAAACARRDRGRRADPAPLRECSPSADLDAIVRDFGCEPRGDHCDQARHEPRPRAGNASRRRQPARASRASHRRRRVPSSALAELFFSAESSGAPHAAR